VEYRFTESSSPKQVRVINDPELKVSMDPNDTEAWRVLMRPQKAPFSGNCEFRNSGIEYYSHRLGTLDISHMMGFSTYCETVRFGEYLF